jgi:hypothetical protein
MNLVVRLTALLALATVLYVTGCDRTSYLAGTQEGPVRAATAYEEPGPPSPAPAPDRVPPQFAPGQLEHHFAKHGGEMGFASEEDYLRAAQALVMGGPGVEILERGGDTLFFKEATGEFAVVSDRNVLRTYFKPDDGRRYWERQMQR